MLIILIILLFVVFTFNYFIFKKNLMSPSVIYSAMFLLSSISAFLISNKLSIDISLETTLVIFLSVVMFSLGELLISYKKSYKQGSPKFKLQKIYNKYNISTLIIFLICIIGIYVLYENFKYIYELSILSGNRYGIEYMLTFAYKGLYAEELLLEKSFLLTQMSVIFRVFVFLLIFASFYNVIFTKDYKLFAKSSIPIVIYVLTLFLNTGRTGFIRFIIYVIIIYGLLVFFRGGRKKANKKFMIIAIFGVIAFVSVYIFYGGLRKSTSDMTMILFRYPGQSIFALNNYLENINYSEFIGQETLTNILSTLRTIGFDVPSGKMALEVTYYGNSSTNIYTSLRRYIADYRFLGLFIIQFILGLFYGKFFIKVIKKYNAINLIFYGFFIFPVVEAIFEERFFITVISVQTVYLLIYIPILYNFLLKKNFSKNRQLV